MPGLRGWLRDYVLNFLRNPERKNNPEKRQSFRKSVMISSPMPLGSMAIDMDSMPPIRPQTSRSAQDVPPPPYPVPILRRSRYVSADQLVPKPIDMIVEDDEPASDSETSRGYTPPPTVIPELSSIGILPEPGDVSPTRRPAATRNFSRRFSRRFSSMSANSAHSYEVDSKRNSRASALSRQDSRDDWVDKRGSSGSGFSQRMSTAFESYQTHTRNYTPLNIY